MIDFSELTVQVTLSIAEMRKLVELINIAGEVLESETGEPMPPVIGEVSGLYFRLMESIREDGYLGEFTPEQ